MANISPPASFPGKRNPRIKPPKYVYTYSDDVSFSEVVQSISNGLPIESVDPKLYKMIYTTLKLRHGQFLQDSNFHAASNVDRAIDDINMYFYNEGQKQERERIKEIEHSLGTDVQKQKEAEKSRKERQRMLKKQLNTAIHQAINEEYDQIDPKLYGPLAKELRRQQRKAIEEDNFAKAAAFDNAARRILVIKDDKKFNEITSSRAQFYDQKVQTLRTDLDDLKYDWKERIREAKRKRDEDIENYRRKAEEELKVFDQKFKEDPPKQYTKYSKSYLNLRVQEKCMMKAKRFQEATELKKYADKKQIEEELDFKRRYQADLELRRNEFLRKTDEKILVREELAARQILKIQREAQLEIERSQKALKHCENQVSEMEHYASMSNPTGTLTSRSRSPKSARAGPIMQPMSARTTRNDRRSVKSVRDLKTPHDISYEREQADLFRQRRAINNIMYTKRSLPAIKKTTA